MSLGVVRSALEIFTRLCMWENVVSCHQMLEETKKAEEVLVKLLEESPKSPKLHCLLGDVRKDYTLYHTAWDLSEGRYPRAMRSLGAHYFKEENWRKCVECYHNALAINPLFDHSWFIMGCAAVRCEDREVATRAFSRVTALDPEVH